MGSVRVWVYRVLVLVGAGLFLLSWSMPWWRSSIQEAGMFVQIRPWGLEHNLGNYVQYMGGDPSLPGFFAPIMWAYLVVAVAVLLVSMFVKEERTVSLGKFKVSLPFGLSLPQVLTGGVGVSYIVFVLTCAIVAYVRTAEFGIDLMGTTYITIGSFDLGAEALSGFEPGYWLACAVGPLCVVLGLFRNKIIGKPKLNA